MLDHFAPERMAFVGVNVSHEELSKWVMRSFADYNAIPLKARTSKAAYSGGYSLEEGSSPFCHLAIGFESGSWGSDTAAIQVLQAVLGGTSAAGGVGSGVTTRLGAQVVKQSPYVESSSAFNIAYSDTGVFGVYTVCEGDKAGEVTASVVKTLAGLSSVKGDELSKAK